MRKIVLSGLLLFLGLNCFSQEVSHSIDLLNQREWKLSSIPSFQSDLFPESELNNDRSIGFNRAKICFFTADPGFYVENPFHNSVTFAPDYLRNHLVRQVYEQELFPEFVDPNYGQINLPVLNVAYYPSEKGAYNYDVVPSLFSAGIDAEGQLKEPSTRWGGISRTIQSGNILSNSNLNFISFWLMDPFVYDTSTNGGSLLIHLGNISEDVLKDGRISLENGLPGRPYPTIGIDTTIWGRVANSFPLVNAFDNDSESRSYQDVGFDGLRDEDERTFFANYLSAISDKFGTESFAYSNAIIDPSSDNFRFYIDNKFNQQQAGIIERYHRYNGLDGNSTINNQAKYIPIGSTLPDTEDVNRNGILDTIENYYQYRINLHPESMDAGRNFITEVKTTNPPNGDGTPVNWYRFLIPIHTEHKEEFGDMATADSMMSIRLILKDFDKPVILRFSTLELRNNDLKPHVNQNGNLLLYPNPVSDHLNIVFKDDGITEINILDLTGRIIISEQAAHIHTYRRFDVSSLKAGVYIISIKTNSGKFSGKFIKAN